MSDITFDVPEGYYLTPFAANMVLSENVESLQFSVNGAPPSISKYVAYDTLKPPNPFIAVTQDGNGNVVYDGGFPKFYNSGAPGVPATPSISMDVVAKCDAITEDESYAYILFSDKEVTVSIGDRLVYEVFQNNASSFVGIDAVTANDPDEFPGQHSLRDWGYPLENAILDQNGLPVNPSAYLEGKADGKWYHREFDLSQVAGNTLVKWFVGYENGTVGIHHTRFRDIYIVNRDGDVKTVLFRNKIDLVDQSTPETTLSGFTELSNTLYDPRPFYNASYKYLYNAILWTANPKKIAAGNRKILIVGDAKIGANYAVRTTGSNGFITSFTRLCAGIGYEPTFKDAGMYSEGYIDETLASLDEYVCVLFMSSVHSAIAYITDSCTQAMLTFREQGNGIIFITDHGPVISNVADAYPPVNGAGFFVTANKVIVNFGAFFTGNYNRTPVNVGFLRKTYGDHPLYDGMGDSENISAAGSESRVQVAIYDSLSPTSIAPFTVGNGQTNIQVAATLKSGEIVTGKVTYNVVSFKVTFSDGTQVRDNGQQLDVGVKNQSLIQVAVAGSLAENAAGIVYKNGTRVGTLSYTQAGGTVQTWDGAGTGPVKVQNGDKFSVDLNAPLSMTSTITIKRFQPQIKAKRELSEIMKILRDYKPALTDIKRVGTVIAEISADVPWLGLKQQLNMPINLKLLGDYFNDEGLASMVLPNAATRPYTTSARPWSATGSWSFWQPLNPVTGGVIDFGYLAFSPVYGSESVPGNFKLDYYANVFIPAGTYQMYAQADDIFDFYMNGEQKAYGGGQFTKQIIVTESKYYALKVSNTNTPANTPSYWTCAMVNTVTGEVVLRPEPGVWKTQEYSAG